MPRIGLIGGTGDIGSALAVHLVKKYEVLLGSRSKEKAEAAIQGIMNEKRVRNDLNTRLKAVTNDYVSSSCDVVLLTVPYAVAIETVMALRDKFSGNQLLISAVAAIQKSGKYFVPIQNASSIAQSIQNILPRTVTVASAFQTIPAKVLYNEETIDADVLVCCDDPDGYLRTADIVSSIQGLRPLYAGSLETAAEIEGLTAILLNVAINGHLKSPTLKIHSF